MASQLPNLRGGMAFHLITYVSGPSCWLRESESQILMTRPYLTLNSVDTYIKRGPRIGFEYRNKTTKDNLKIFCIAITSLVNIKSLEHT